MAGSTGARGSSLLSLTVTATTKLELSMASRINRALSHVHREKKNADQLLSREWAEWFLRKQFGIGL